MLSRHADACYWIGRYVERAEATARMVDVHYHAALESFLAPAIEGVAGEGNPIGWQSILTISGSGAAFRSRYGEETDRDILHFFAFDTGNPNSILSTWASARENARSVRDMIASEMWEALNIFHMELREWNVDRVLSQQSPHIFFQAVKNASHLLQGILNRTMMMGETRDWLDTGRFLERGSQTVRLLDVKYHDLLPAIAHPAGSPAEQRKLDAVDSPPAPARVPVDPYGVGGPLDTHGWTAVLRSVSAFEMFRKTYRDGIRPASVVDFLILSPNFPASARYCIERVETCLHRIGGSQRADAVTVAERLTGRLRADLTYAQAAEIILTGLHEFLTRVQRRHAAIDEAIISTYLQY